MKPLRVLILGGGYAGLACLRTLSRHIRRGTYAVQLLDASPYHTIKTRFHERAVYENRDLLLRLPLAPIVGAAGAGFLHDTVQEIDHRQGKVRGTKGEHGYDRLIFALGGEIAHFGVPGAAQHTVSLQTYPDTCECSRRLTALKSSPAADRLRVVVCGAGVEGLEVAAMVRQRFSAERCEVTVIERSDTVLARSQCRESQRTYLKKYLEQHRINLRLGATIAAVAPDAVEIGDGTRVPANLVYWCAGVRRVEIGGTPPNAPFPVNRYLQAEDHPEVFAAGDFATVDDDGEFSNLASAQRAVYHGRHAAENLWRFDHLRLLRPARYRPIGEMIALGDLDGVGSLYSLPVHGAAAAALKKANELKYLSEVYRDLPRAAVARILPDGEEPVPYPKGPSRG